MFTWGPVKRGASSGGGGGPIPWFLDTFTAANGTDPTTRSVDYYPDSEFALWKPNYTNDRGQINSNRLYVKSGEERSLVSAYKSDQSELTISGDYFLLLIADSGPIPSGGTGNGYIRFSVSGNDTYTDYAAMKLYAGGNVYAELSGSTDYYETLFPAYNVGTGLKKLGLYVSNSGMNLLCDGAVVDSYSSTMGHTGKIAYLTVDMYPDGIYPLSGYVDSAGIYTGISLVEAQAMTV